jgi:chorismate mutase
VNDISDTATTETSTAISLLRERIDQIDESLIELWCQRAQLSRQIGAARIAAGGTRLVLSRESQVLRRFREGLGDEGVQVALLLLRAGRGPL